MSTPSSDAIPRAKGLARALEADGDMGGCLERRDAPDEPEVLRIDLLMHQDRHPVGDLVEEVFGRSRFRAAFGKRLGKQGEKLLPDGIAEKERVADKRVAAASDPAEQRVVFIGEIGAQNRRERAAEPEVFEDHDLASRDRPAGGDIERQPEPSHRAATAIELRRRLEQPAPRRIGKRAVETKANPARQPLERFRGDGVGIGQQVGIGDSSLERSQDAFEVVDEALEEVRSRRRSRLVRLGAECVLVIELGQVALDI